MTAHSNIGQTAVDVHTIPEMRLDSTAFKRMRHASEHSEIFSELSDGVGVGGVPGRLTVNDFGSTVKRRGPVRSMTEVRPSITSESFLTCDVARPLRQSHVREVDSNTQGNVVEDKEESLSALKVRYS